MKVTLSFEESQSSDVSIMVDALRASTTITLALNSFERIIPCFTPEEAFELKEKTGGIIAGERGGKKIDGFDVGNSPTALNDFKTDEKTLILTTSNGTRILKNMAPKALVGSMINAEAVAKRAIEMAESHIDVVMAGVKGEFAIEDFLASGEIIYNIRKHSKDIEVSEYAKSAIMASRDPTSVRKAFMSSRSAGRLIELGYESDVELCMERNISENVAVYANNELNLYISF